MRKVNLKTLAATTESLPSFLHGLMQESLNDLFWTDEALGVQDLAWYPETDITVYDDTKVLDGTEALVIDSVNKIVKVTKGQRVKTAEELAVEKTEALNQAKEEMEQAIESHINSTIVAKGYNSQDSIAKYLVVENPFYTECAAFSLWIGDVWEYSYQVQADVMDGIRTIPTTEELIAELPVLGV